MAEFKKIKLPTEKFGELLSNSPKLLFSGKFGSGKTTFINDFFEENIKYDKLHIYPVNYSIVSTPDIFELIKYDILFQLLGKIAKKDFEKLDFPFELTLWHYLIGVRDLDSKADFLLSFFNFAGSTGKAVLEVYDKLKILRKKYIAFQKKLKKDDLKSAKEYLERATQKKGHVYEEDFFTELIRNLIDQLKKNKKEIVLVIDDLDRLDPDHIFRILNIFSAHIDFRGEEDDNKFNFDKVILVCDYENIQSVFHHRYGNSADFKGYIDKFYSNAFWFDPSTAIKAIVISYLDLINNGDNGGLFHLDSRIGGHIQYVMKELMGSNLITFRDLMAYDKIFDTNDLHVFKSQRQRTKTSALNSFSFNAEFVIYFLHLFFRKNKTGIIKIIASAKTLNNTRSYDANDPDNSNKIAELLLFKEHKRIHDLINFGNNKSFNISYKDLNFQCSLLTNDFSVGVSCSEVFKGETKIDPNNLNYFEFLEEGINDFRKFYSL